MSLADKLLIAILVVGVVIAWEVWIILWGITDVIRALQGIARK